MSYVTASLRARARRAREEAEFWRAEAVDGRRLHEARVYMAHDLKSTLPEFVSGDMVSENVTIATKTLERGQKWSIYLRPEVPDLAAYELASCMTDLLRRAVSERSIPYRVCAVDRIDGLARLEVETLRVPMSERVRRNSTGHPPEFHRTSSPKQDPADG